MTFRILPLLFFVSLGWMACGGGGTGTENATDTGMTQGGEQPVETVVPRADAEFEDPLVDKVFQNYLNLRSALVNSDAGEAATAAGNMAETFADARPQLRDLAQAIADTDDLAVQRQHFSELTAGMGDVLEEEISGGTIYRMHCPMAFDGAGADWYSEVDEVRNPYFGDKMLTCGSVTAEIGG